MTGLRTREVRNRLRQKFEQHANGGAPEHVVAFEVPIDGRPRFVIEGHGPVLSRQRIDAVAVGIWKRTRHLVHGFEIKVSRADLIVELRDPSKAAAGVSACDTWSLVLGDATLLKDTDEIPDGWGVVVPHARGLRYLVKPTEREGNVDRRVMAGIVQASLRSHGACRGLASVDTATRYMRDSEKRIAEIRRSYDRSLTAILAEQRGP